MIDLNILGTDDSVPSQDGKCTPKEHRFGMTRTDHELVYTDGNVHRVLMVGGIGYAHAVINTLYTLKDAVEGDTVHLHIVGPGGQVATGSMIIDAINTTKATVITHNNGMAASMHAMILASGHQIDPGKGVTMFHNMIINMYNNVSIVKHHSESISGITASVIGHLVEKGILLDTEKNDILENDVEIWFTGDELRERLSGSDLLYKGEER